MCKKRLVIKLNNLGILHRNLNGRFAVYDDKGEELRELHCGDVVTLIFRRSRGGWLHIETSIEYGKDYYATEVPQLSLDGVMCRFY